MRFRAPGQKKPIPEDLLGFSPAYEVIGDIALLEDPNLDTRKRQELPMPSSGPSQV